MNLEKNVKPIASLKLGLLSKRLWRALLLLTLLRAVLVLVALLIAVRRVTPLRVVRLRLLPVTLWAGHLAVKTLRNLKSNLMGAEPFEKANVDGYQAT